MPSSWPRRGGRIYFRLTVTPPSDVREYYYIYLVRYLIINIIVFDNDEFYLNRLTIESIRQHHIDYRVEFDAADAKLNLVKCLIVISF